MLADDLLYLRKLEEGDLERTWHWINDPGIFLKIGSRVPISRKEQKAWFDQLSASKEKIVLAICLRESDLHIGNVSLDSIDDRNRAARLSIFLGEAQRRRASLGSRALSLVIYYAFNFLNLNRIWCKATAGDPGIVRFYESFGFRQEGVMRQHEFVDGSYVDKIIFGLIRAEWAPRSLLAGDI